MEDFRILKEMIMKVIIVSFILILSLILFTSSAFAGGPWKGRIIDIETKEPIEGAVVLAVWDRNYRTPTGGNSYFYEAKEVLTNKEGRFEIASYTPINLLPLISYIEGPYFTIFKPGYGSLSRSGLEKYFLGKGVDPKEGEISGKRYRFALGLIELPPLKTREERLDKLPLGLTYYDETVKKAKNYMRLLNIERRELGLDPIPIPENGGRK